MNSDESKRKPLTRIFINEEGNLIVSDLWEEVFESLVDEDGDDFVLKS